jgi:signal transduction histidine kinase
VLWVQRERAAVLAPGRAFLVRSGVVLLLVLAVSLPLVWILSARITVPLERVAVAAEAVSRGDYTRRVAMDRADEIGRLGHAFNVMASEVSASHERQEARVAERTAELSAALEELRVTQEQLIRKEKLAVLGALAGGVGHELRTPLSVITNALYVIEHEVGDTSAKVREYIGMCRAQLAISDKIIGDLLELGRARSAARKPTSVGTLVDAQVARLDGAGRFTLERHVPADLPDALVDPVQMGQVVFNVLVNAQQSMEPAGGPLRVRAAAERDGRAVILEVSDSGVGIPAADLKRIFEPLYTTKPHGFGLGLAVSRELANVNDTEILVQSAVGEGTTVTLRMPCAPASGASLRGRS